MSATVGVGVDLLSIDRLERALERRPSLAGRLFTPGELDRCSSLARPARHLAARFCAKEAAIKALRLEHGSLADFEVEGGGRDPVRLALKGRAAARARDLGVRMEVSVTHDRDLAAAIAVALSG